MLTAAPSSTDAIRAKIVFLDRGTMGSSIELTRPAVPHAWRTHEMTAPDEILINTARGGLVDEAGLVVALDEGLITGFGFDVLTSEPPANDNPILSVANRPNVIVTPHTAWASAQAMEELWRQVVESLDTFLAGSPVRTP